MADESTPASGAPGSTPLRPGPLERFRKAGVIVAVVVLAVFVGAELVQVILRPSVAPTEQLVRAQDGYDAEAIAELQRRFPRDPRVLFLAALSAWKANDHTSAEAHLRAALAEERALREESPNGDLQAALRAMLAHLLLERGDDAEAREALRPSCGPPLEAVAEKAGLAREWVADACSG